MRTNPLHTAPRRCRHIVLASFCLVLAGFSVAHAGHINLTWLPPTTTIAGEPVDLSGYRLYYGLESSSAVSPPCNTTVVEIPEGAAYVLEGLTTDSEYFLRITARDEYGNESACSNEATGIALASAAEAPAPAATTPPPAPSPSPSPSPIATPTPATPTPAPPAAPTEFADPVPASSGGGGGGGCFIATAAYGSPLAAEVGALRAFRGEYMLSNRLGAFLAAAYASLSPPVADWLRERPAARAVTRAALGPLVWWAKLTLAAPGAGFALAAVCLAAAPGGALLAARRVRRGRRGAGR